MKKIIVFSILIVVVVVSAAAYITTTIRPEEPEVVLDSARAKVSLAEYVKDVGLDSKYLRDVNSLEDFRIEMYQDGRVHIIPLSGTTLIHDKKSWERTTLIRTQAKLPSSHIYVGADQIGIVVSLDGGSYWLGYTVGATKLQ